MRKAFHCIVILFGILSAAGFGISDRIAHRNDANAAPVITMATDEITVSVADGPEAILEGISARDREDGDVTDSLLVESLGNMIDRNCRSAVICAFDSDSHTAKIRRKVCYQDYHAPRFSLSGPLMAASTSPSAVMDRIRATDVIDGDISDQIQVITESTISTASVGEYPVCLLVSNSAGDTVELEVTLTTYAASDKAQAPTINLKDYLIYVKKGSPSIDPFDYLDSVKSGSREWETPLKKSDFKVVNPVDTSLPGVYEILYQLRDYADNQAAKVRLIVVVEE